MCELALGHIERAPAHAQAAAAARPAHLCKQHAGKGQALLLSQRQGGGPVRHCIQVAADALQQLAQLQQGRKRKQGLSWAESIHATWDSFQQLAQLQQGCKL